MDRYRYISNLKETDEYALFKARDITKHEIVAIK